MVFNESEQRPGKGAGAGFRVVIFLEDLEVAEGEIGGCFSEKMLRDDIQ